ncbi:hypothetical protein DL546_002700 [Coniochaeta pulveracea]|uniref:Dynactin subunit 4 n=1 Tax=Coniochaeta pulveracea TaxID=177199 RepID=A0A420YJ95_9PEZI|nr:hypothetical protein DL546_002700 [Coniochaeta pulveracea]
MAPLSPYTYIQCPCSDAPSQARPSETPTRDIAADQDDDDRTFDPRAPRSNYSLYPLEYLLYCEDCHQIRCPRCVAEEIVTYYCPSCLFEVPSSNLKSEGNRCTRSCFQCPVCIGPLQVTSLETPPDPNLLAADNTSSGPSGPYILACAYCHWSSIEIGIKFDKPNGIYSQLQKLRNGGQTRLTAKERKDRRKEAMSTGSFASTHPSNPGSDDVLDVESQFENLRTFYSHQLSESTSAAPGLSMSDLGISSPSSLARLMNYYNVGSLDPSKKGLGNSRGRARLGTFREALDTEEGLQLAQLDESASISAFKASTLSDLTTTSQRLSQAESHLSNLVSPALHGSSRLTSTLRPIPVLLRTKRSKRCPVCRHIISKPEPKVASTRFRIRLVAGSYIPAVSIRPLRVPGVTPPPPPDGLLRPLVPAQYLLTFTNPLFEPVKVTLATPSTTPGRFASKVTVLCPQFEIDANTDVWDEALKSGSSETSRRRDEGSKAGGVAEVGKIWERGRNWVSIVVEVVPALIKTEGGEELKEDEDVLEIPMFIRIEWEADATGAEVGAAPGTGKEVREKRELAYWSALGIGRIGSLGQLG